MLLISDYVDGAVLPIVNKSSKNKKKKIKKVIQIKNKNQKTE